MLLKNSGKELKRSSRDGQSQQESRRTLSISISLQNPSSWKFYIKVTGHMFLWLCSWTPNSCHSRAHEGITGKTPEQHFTPEGQDFKTAGMCLVKTWGCLGSWKPPQGISTRTTAFPRPGVMNLKINFSDPHALRICWERMLPNPATRVNNREGKRG